MSPEATAQYVHFLSQGLSLPALRARLESEVDNLDADTVSAALAAFDHAANVE